MFVRKATADDADGIAQVQLRGWQIGYKGLIPDAYLQSRKIDDLTEHWLTMLDESPTTFLVADVNGALVGFAGYDTNGDGLGDNVGELHGLYVEPDCWGRGIGSALIDEVHRGLDDRFAEAILWTLEADERTRRFYEHRGWSADGATKLHRSGASLLRLRRSLP